MRIFRSSISCLAGDTEPVGHFLDVQALVVDQERNQLQHPGELVLGGALPGPRRPAGVGECGSTAGLVWKSNGGLEAADDGGPQVGRSCDEDVGTVGGKLLRKLLRITELDHDAVPRWTGHGWLLRGHGPPAQRKQPAAVDFQRGLAQREFVESIQFSPGVESGRRLAVSFRARL